MQQTKSKNIKHPLSKKQKLLVYILVFLVIGLVLEVAVSHNITFYAKWIECKQKPVQTKGSGYLNSGVPHYYEPSSLPGIHASIDYFCTPLEAERAGYSANSASYEYPNLNEHNR